MSRELRQFTPTIPAGTLPAAPVTVDMGFPDRVVDRVEIIVPPGPSGLVGFALLNSGRRVIPFDSDLWIITADEKIVWDLEGYIDSGAWGLLAYNSDIYDHSIAVRFLLSLASATDNRQAVTFIPDAQLTGGVFGG